MVINFIYILLAIMIFIFIYSEIILETRNENPYSITIELDMDVINTDKLDVYDHLYTIKNNLYVVETMQSSIDSMYLPQLTEITQYAIYDLNMFQDQNEYTSNGYNTPTIGNLILKLNEVISIMGNGLDSDTLMGILPLTNLHRLVRLTSHLFSNSGYFQYDDIFRDDTNNYISHYTWDMGGLKPYTTASARVNKSQDEQYNSGYRRIMSNDEYTVVFKQAIQNKIVERNSDNSGVNTQKFSGSDVTYITKRDTIPNYIPFCDITKALEDKRRRVMHMVDKNAKGGLRDDYKF
jgi:hypothetical protein